MAEITGKLIAMLPVDTGTKKNGDAWSKQPFVIETTEQYPKKIYMEAWDNIGKAMANTPLFSVVKADVNIESREFNDKWYTNIRAWKFEVITKAEANESTGEVYQAEVLPPHTAAMQNPNPGSDEDFPL